MKKVIYKFLALQGALMVVIYFVVDYYFFNKGHNFIESLITAVLFSLVLLFVFPLVLKLFGKLRKQKNYTLQEGEKLLLQAEVAIPAYMSVQKTYLKLTNKHLLFLQGREEQVYPYNKVKLVDNRNLLNSEEHTFYLSLDTRKNILFITNHKEKILKILRSKI
ncbi:hypothetical protein [Haloflavibacter putidus]|uniref:GRAM domain-containing protein n=1 Tax=Haloflavibacter putidus TaxID=2576776 RepID=A0A507ZSG5_9FLAO|nr:hypothetical protein [Haloflavibacter putidus]TQD40570.1 hypothetical protein FKR84_00920 [Haloflavibacter putidus]